MRLCKFTFTIISSLPCLLTFYFGTGGYGGSGPPAFPLAGAWVGVGGAFGTGGGGGGGPPAFPLAGAWVGVGGAFGTGGCGGGGPPAFLLAGVWIRTAVEAFVAVAARPVVGGTCVFSSFSCEEETWNATLLIDM